MAGKVKWGGQRSNQTGRPRRKTSVSEATKKKWVQAANKFAKKHGMTVQEAILEMIADKDVQDSCRVAAAKLYNEALIAKESVQDINVSQKAGPSVGLPTLKQDPALKVVGGKG